jgi:hypothetical protein
MYIVQVAVGKDLLEKAKAHASEIFPEDRWSFDEDSINFLEEADAQKFGETFQP